MKGLETTYTERIESLKAFLADFAESDDTLAAICDDGWPEDMARAGLQMHRVTWNSSGVIRAFERELSAVGGPSALRRCVDGLRVVPPSRVSHIWPMLPGAGVTPTLFGYLVGASQFIRASSRGCSFADHFIDTWQHTIGDSLERVSDDRWWDADIVVVSGSDDTVREIRRMTSERSSLSTRVTGYGHRVSFAVVVDGPDTDLVEVATALSRDIVMWHQRGCFSCRAVLVAATDARRRELGEALGEAIAEREVAYSADDVSDAELAHRAQARGTAEFLGHVWGDGLGWASLTDDAWSGERPSIHSVRLHRLHGLDDLGDRVDVDRRHLQGVALHVPDAERPAWVKSLAEIGVTRVCEPGQLQMPAAEWPHDGRPNVLEWLHLVSCGT